MIWVDRTAKKIKERGLPLEWVDDMKTPSGRIHVGSLRGVLIHDLMHKGLLQNNINSKFTYVFNDHDPMDGLPAYLDKNKYEQYMGKRLYEIPSPEKGYKNYAEYYAKEFQEVFERINCHPEIIWSSQLYLSGKMNEVIKIVLDSTDKIKDIYLRVSKADKGKDWHPFQTVCEKCGKVGTTYVYKWDGEYVHYRCMPRMVEWAFGCGYEGKVSPFNGTGKLVWKLDWPAHWYVMGVTIEGSGKDHMSAGGSYDFASEVMKEVFNLPAPYPIPYEWFTAGGRGMSSSKGIGSSAKEVSEILPSEIFRFLIVRTPIERALDFNPYGDTIPNLFDDYDRCMSAYFDVLENKLPEGKKGEVISDFSRIAELSQVDEPPTERHILPRFRTVVSLVKQNKDILSHFEGIKGSSLNSEEKKLLEERVVFAEVYINKYQATDMNKIKVIVKLSEKQKEFLKAFSEGLNDKMTVEDIKTLVFNTAKEGGFKVRDCFQAIYISLIETTHGPNIGELVISIGVGETKKKINLQLGEP